MGQNASILAVPFVKGPYSLDTLRTKNLQVTGLFQDDPGPEFITLFFMLNSPEHEIYPAHKC